MNLHEVVSLYVQYQSCRWVAVVKRNAIYPRAKDIIDQTLGFNCLCEKIWD